MFVIEFWLKRFAADTAERSNLLALINSLELSADKDNGMICLVSVAVLFIAFVAPLAVMRLVIIAVVGKYFLVILWACVTVCSPFSASASYSLPF